jgi:hypothetical protein
LFTELETRPVVLSFDQTHGSSDGGAILLSAANQRYNQQVGLIETMAPVCRIRVSPARSITNWPS